MVISRLCDPGALSGRISREGLRPVVRGLGSSREGLPHFHTTAKTRDFLQQVTINCNAFKELLMQPRERRTLVVESRRLGRPERKHRVFEVTTFQRKSRSCRHGET